MLIIDSEQRTGNKIRRCMQCLLTRISNQKNLTPTEYQHRILSVVATLRKRNLRKFPDRISHSLGLFSLEASTASLVNSSAYCES